MIIDIVLGFQPMEEHQKGRRVNELVALMGLIPNLITTQSSLLAIVYYQSDSSLDVSLLFK